MRENSANVTTETSCFRVNPDGSKECEYYNINICYLCEKICEAALAYYSSNKELFNFFEFRIINTDDATARTFGLTGEAAEEMIRVKL